MVFIWKVLINHPFVIDTIAINITPKNAKKNSAVTCGFKVYDMQYQHKIKNTILTNCFVFLINTLHKNRNFVETK